MPDRIPIDADDPSKSVLRQGCDNYAHLEMLMHRVLLIVGAAGVMLAEIRHDGEES